MLFFQVLGGSETELRNIEDEIHLTSKGYGEVMKRVPEWLTSGSRDEEE